MAEELSILPLVYLLISPMSWVHYFILALIPLTFIWLKIVQGEGLVKDFQVGVVSVVTIVLGTSLLDYLAVVSHASILALFVVGLWPLATVALILVAMSLIHGRFAFQSGKVRGILSPGKL